MDISNLIGRGFSGRGGYVEGGEIEFENFIVRGQHQVQIRVKLWPDDGVQLYLDIALTRSLITEPFRSQLEYYVGSSYRGAIVVLIEELDQADDGTVEGLVVRGEWRDEYANLSYPFGDVYLEPFRR